MCSIQIIPSHVTQLKGAAYCKNQMDDLEKEIIRTRYCRYSEFNRMLSKLTENVVQLIKNNKDNLDLFVTRHRLIKLQADLEKRSFECLSKNVHEYSDYIVKKSPEAICWEHRTLCRNINLFAGEIDAFYRRAFPKGKRACDGLMSQLSQARNSIDIHFEGGDCGIPFKVISPGFQPHRFFHYASNETLLMAASYFSSQLEDFYNQINDNENCQYFKYKFPFEQLSIKIKELEGYSNEHNKSDIASMQNRLQEIKTLLQERCIDSLQNRITDFCTCVFQLLGEELMYKRNKIQRKFCQYRLEIIQICEFASLDKTDQVIYKLNQKLLRVKAAIDPCKVWLCAQKEKESNPPFFVFFLVSLSSSFRRSTPPSSPSPSLSSSSSSSIAEDPLETMEGSRLILQEMEQVKRILSLFDQNHIDEVMVKLQSFQTKIYFEISDSELTVGERVLFHYIRSNYVSSSRVRRSILRTYIELTIAGFVEVVKEKGRRAAENAFMKQFQSLGIGWRYCYLSQKIHIESCKNLDDARAYSAMDKICAYLKKDWSLK